MAATIYDVAKRAGVSTATVSKVLSNTPYVSDSTRAKVLVAVEELNYVPSLAARGLSKARTYLISLIIPYTSDYVYSDPHLLELIRGIESEAKAQNYSVLLSTGSDAALAAAGQMAQRSQDRALRDTYTDGVILIAASVLPAPPERLGLQAVPCVSVGYRAPAGCTVAVHADDREGAAAAVRHLLALGHRRIGAITAVQPITALTRRLEGYRQALAEAGLAFDPALVASGDFSSQSGYQAAGELLAAPQQPTAIFAFNDRMAMGAIRRLRDAGLSVPQDVAVVGFDDIPEAALFDPPLTTVRQPALQMGITAARSLFHLIERRPGTAPETVLPAALVVRTSCGARPQNVRSSP